VSLPTARTMHAAGFPMRADPSVASDAASGKPPGEVICGGAMITAFTKTRVKSWCFMPLCSSDGANLWLIDSTLSCAPSRRIVTRR